MAIDWAPFRKIIDDHETFVISSHVRPDADALGSELALANMLESEGKRVQIVNASASPGNLDFLDPDKRVKRLGDTITVTEVLNNDVHVIVDTSAWTQLAGIGDLLKKTKAKKVVIDHHVSSDDLGAVEFKDTTAEATGTLLHRLAMALDLPITKPSAEALYAAIATDTGWFRFPSINAETMRVIADLMDRGVEPFRLYQLLYERRSIHRLHLTGRVMAKVRAKCDGRLAFTTVEEKDFESTGSTPLDTEGMVNQCLTIDGVQASFIAVEQQNKRIKISFRSRPGVNVALIAEQFGGGGHKQASGATMEGPIRVAVGKVLSAFEKAFAVDSEDEA